jgi:hypothetical protein
MPWHSQSDVQRHNKSAGKSRRKGKVWRKVANRVLQQTGDEGRAIREANATADRVHSRADRLYKRKP